jgi:hypothetical protein
MGDYHPSLCTGKSVLTAFRSAMIVPYNSFLLNSKD